MTVGDAIRLEPNTVLCGAYRIECWLGGGGYGDVYRAVAVGLGRAVAVKVLRPHRGRDESSLARFRREAAMAMRLEHPHTVRPLDFATLDDGTPMLVWEYLRGETLAARLERSGPLTPLQVAHFARGVLASLQEAHEAGIVHRDIKPSNLMLCDFAGEHDFVKVLDFGVAKDLSGVLEDLTGEGEVLGTPRYMAPEQVLGRAVAPATDLYALGLVMAESLTGVAVVAASSKTQVVALQATESDLELDPAVLAGPFGELIRRATRKKLGARFPSATAMRAEIDGVLRRIDTAQEQDPDATRSVRSPEPRGAQTSTGAPVSVPQAGQPSGERPAIRGATLGKGGIVAGAMAGGALLVVLGVAWVRPWGLLGQAWPAESAPSPGAAPDSGLADATANTPFALPVDVSQLNRNDPLPDGVDPRAFDAIGFISVATELARHKLADAALTNFSVEGVWHGDRADTTCVGCSAHYVFRSPSASVPPPGHPTNVRFQASCEVWVSVDDRGLTVVTARTECDRPILRTPHCRPTQVLNQLLPQLDAGAGPIAVDLMVQSRDDGVVRWHAVAGELGHAYIADDCR